MLSCLLVTVYVLSQRFHHGLPDRIRVGRPNQGILGEDCTLQGWRKYSVADGCRRGSDDNGSSVESSQRPSMVVAVSECAIPKPEFAAPAIVDSLESSRMVRCPRAFPSATTYSFFSLSSPQ
ncbi:hypothetical protein BO71DRAFT_87587 [Aspergillus ellipticus CBS 707.79]|uniref:Uncharacterized protein n=1 Tax=Aspergillus ellipticus CBS 707.79 TaxID=1448320 RepID=A0A319DK76_9EURO|nr:hypothetical protein BO71DRAFT_87587 [Aspergillus ellipticus CBS 707.79]